MKILHTADLHIGAELSYLGAAADTRKYEVLEVFRKKDLPLKQLTPNRVKGNMYILYYHIYCIACYLHEKTRNSV